MSTSPVAEKQRIDENGIAEACASPAVDAQVNAPPIETPIETPDTANAATIAKTSAVGVTALALSACGGGGETTSVNGGPVAIGGGGGGSSEPTVIRPSDDPQASRFLLQASFAAVPGAIEQVREDGYEPWLDRQMATRNSQSAREFFASRNFDIVDDNRWYDRTETGDFMIWSQLMSGGSSVRKRFALALSEFFVVSLSGINTTWRAPAIGEYWDILNRHAFGNFRDLLEDITLNPAMGIFLNTRGNKKADPRSGRVPDENFGREILQLFTIGLFELNSDGSVRTSGGAPIETYDNDDITGIAKVFTGYDLDYTDIGFSPAFNNANREIPDPDFVRNPMTSDPSRWRRPRDEGFHSEDEKQFLGLTIPAGTDAAESLRLTLDHLVAHPNVGPFFGKQMIQRLVTSNPSPAYVERVSNAFDDNGSGVRGDLGAVFKAILLDQEALDPDNVSNPAFGKLREPMLRFVQLGRTFGARSTSGNWEVRDLSDASGRLGQSPLRSPSVFNFFRPAYFPPGSQAAQNNLLAPEFQLVNETSVAGYVNFMERAIETRGFWVEDLELDYSDLVAIADDTEALLSQFDLLFTANQLSQEVRDTIKTAVEDVEIDETSSDEDRLRRVHIAALLTLASTDYLIQK